MRRLAFLGWGRVEFVELACLLDEGLEADDLVELLREEKPRFFGLLVFVGEKGESEVKESTVSLRGA